MADDLQARLQSHSKAFEGLMSLIPAEHYYGKDNSEQWKAKKQTKEQKRQAKKAKLDPANSLTALDVHKDNERKRKRELGESDDISDRDDVVKETPKQGLKSAAQQSKKQKVATADPEARQKQVAEKRREARERKKAKKAKEQAKKEAKKGRKTLHTTPVGALETEVPNDGDDQDKDEEAEGLSDHEMADFDLSGLEAEDDARSESSVASIPDSPTFDNANSHSSASSSSSIVPPAESVSASKANIPSALLIPTLKAEQPKLAIATAPTESSTATIRDGTKSPKLPTIDSSVLQARLAARLEALRTARKADGLDGKPAKNRQELIEARRRKEEQRRAHKKELRAKARVEKDAEAEAARLRGGSGSPLWSPAIMSPKQENNFEFGRVAFEDGAELDSSLKGLMDPRRKKGPQDTKTILEAAQRKKARVNGLDAEKRADIEEKDRWLAAKKRVHGEKVRDDPSLLRKTLKREEKQKGKSERAWNERIEGVKHGKEMKQKRREENLQKRRDGKGVKGKKMTGKPKPKKRPGFEGSFKAGGAKK